MIPTRRKHDVYTEIMEKDVLHAVLGVEKAKGDESLAEVLERFIHKTLTPEVPTLAPHRHLSVEELKSVVHQIMDGLCDRLLGVYSAERLWKGLDKDTVEAKILQTMEQVSHALQTLVRGVPGFQF